MIRPLCPCCKRKSVVTTSRRSGEWRLQYFGCKRCQKWRLGKDMIPVTAKRTRTVISTIPRETSGRFANAR